jgi:hypothetical protein
VAVVLYTRGSGARQGWRLLPTRVAQATAPVTAGLAREVWGAPVLWLQGGLGMPAFKVWLGMPGVTRNCCRHPLI